MRVRMIPILLLAGCATADPGLEPRTPAEPPAAWTGAAAAAEYAVGADWWEEFGDPGLAAAVREALANNPVLDEAAARERAADALARIAGADLRPQIGAGGTAGVARQFTGKLPLLPETRKSESYGASLNLSWEIDVWGRIRAGRTAALRDAEALRALHRGAALSLAAQTAKAWFTAVEARGQLEVARANRESAESLAERIRERFERGLRGALDMKLARTEVESARAQVALRERLLDSAVRQLETLMGRYPAGDLEDGGDLVAVPPPVPAGIPAGVIARRPDLVAAERTLRASTARVAEAGAALYPRIAITGENGFASSDFSDVVAGDFGVWSLVGSLTAPIWSGGRLRANVALREAREEEAVAAFANAVLDAWREVETALAAESLLARREAALGALVEEARAGREISEERFLSGLTNILSVLEARQRYFAARSGWLASRRERLTTRIDLIAALGGGFHRDEILLAKEN